MTEKFETQEFTSKKKTFELIWWKRCFLQLVRLPPCILVKVGLTRCQGNVYLRAYRKDLELLLKASSCPPGQMVVILSVWVAFNGRSKTWNKDEIRPKRRVISFALGPFMMLGGLLELRHKVSDKKKSLGSWPSWLNFTNQQKPHNTSKRKNLRMIKSMLNCPSFCCPSHPS